MSKLILASDVEKVFATIVRAGLLDGHTQGVFIPTASLGRNYSAFFDQVVRPDFLELGIDMTMLEIAQAQPAELAEELQRATVVYVGGGNTFLLLEKIRATGFAGQLAAFLRKGGLYIGASAGAVVAGPDVAFIACMDARPDIPPPDFSGLKLVDFNVLPHTDHPQYGSLARQAHLGGWPTIGLREEQFLYIDGTYLEVF